MSNYKLCFDITKGKESPEYHISIIDTDFPTNFHSYDCIYTRTGTDLSQLLKGIIDNGFESCLRELSDQLLQALNPSLDIKISYDGKYPCLCMGHLVVWINGTKWDFGTSALSSGGSICRDDNWDMWAEDGEWDIYDHTWPEGFPEIYKEPVLEKINEEIPHGCCGGCI